MADFLKTLTKRNTTKPGQPAQPELVISGPQTFRTGIHVSFDNEKGFQGLPKGVGVSKEGGYVLDELAGLNAEDVPESLRLGAPSSGAHKPPAAPTTRPSSKKKGSGFEISGPTTFQHKLHVDEEYNWTGTDPTGAVRLLDKLGEGAYGSVYKAEAKDAKMVLAIKMVLIGKDQGEIRKEIDILKKCKHENVVRYFGSATKDNYLWIMMDFCGAGSLQDQIKRLKQVQSPDFFLEKEIQYVMYGSLAGLKYLHSLPIIHRDIKSGNILLTEDGRVKLADFGVSAQLNETLTRSKSFVGTALWMSPEVLEQEPYDQKADIWALGITAIELADGVPPHFSTNQMRAMFLIPQLPPPTFKTADKWSAPCNAFLARALKKDPRERPDAATLLQDPFMQEGSKLTPDLLLELFARAKAPSSSEPSEESPYSSLERKQQVNQDAKAGHDGSPRPPPASADRKESGPTKGGLLAESAKPGPGQLTISNPQFMKNKKVGDPVLDQLVPIKNELENQRSRNAELERENASLKERVKKLKKKLKETQKDLDMAEEDLEEAEAKLQKLEGKLDKKHRKSKKKEASSDSDSDGGPSPQRPLSPTTPGATQDEKPQAQQP